MMARSEMPNRTPTEAALPKVLDSLTDSSAKQRDSELPRVHEAQYQVRAHEVLAQSRQGHQIAVVDAAGNVRSIIGLNGVRAFPKPILDPLFAESLQSTECPPPNKAAPWVM